VGLRWQARPWIAFKANAGRYYRLPTLLELFGNAGSVSGSADLVPERGVNRDLGVVLNFTRAGAARPLRVEVSHFQNNVENLILFFPNSQYTSKPANIGSARLEGWETSVSVTLFTRLDASVGYTYMDTEDTSEIPYYRGNDLPSRPAHDVNASVAYAWRSVRTTYELHHVSANWLDRANLRATPARNLHALTVTVETPADGVSLSVEGRNLTDERATDVAGFPLPGRSIYSTILYRH
jgi:iron complex outermembrane receptor protein